MPLQSSSALPLQGWCLFGVQCPVSDHCWLQNWWKHVMVMSYPYAILEVSLQRHKTRGHCEQPLEVAFLRLDQCGGALAAAGWGEGSRWRRWKVRWQWAWKPSKWVRKSLGLDGDVDDEESDIMKTKEDPVTGSEVRHNHGSPVIAFTASSRGSSCKRYSRNGWQMRQWLGKNLRHNNV